MRRLLTLALALLLASPLFGQMQISDMEFQDVTITSATVANPAEDWADNMVAVYDFEASGDPWMNDVNSSGGSGCDMAIETGTPTRETGVFKEGTASALFEDVGGEGEDIDTTCNDLGSTLDDSSITWGGWVYSATDALGEWVNAGNGYGIRRDGTGSGRLMCRVGPTVTAHYGTSDAWPATTWVHLVCTYDHANQEIDSYADGVSGVSATAHTTGMTASNLKLGGIIGEVDKYWDEMFVYSGEMSATSVCRIASCGIDGSLCTCNGTAWVDDGRNDGIGAGDITCTLSATCNEAAP